MSTPSKRPQIKHRSRARGAAMVEAAIVLPVMVAIYGTIMFAGIARHKKQGVMAEVRSSIFTHASRGCDGTPSLYSPGSAPGSAGGPPVGANLGTGGLSDADPAASYGISGNPTTAADTAPGEQGTEAASDAANDAQLQSRQRFNTTSGSLSRAFTRTGAMMAANGTWDPNAYTANVSHHSFYFCNEKAFTGPLAFFNYAADVASDIFGGLFGG